MFFYIFFVCKNANWIFSETQKKFQKQARKRYRNLPEEDKNKKREYLHERYKICLKMKNKS